MSQHHWRSGLLSVSAVAAAVVLAGCGALPGPPPPRGSSNLDGGSSAAGTTADAPPGSLSVSAEVGKQLCQKLAPQVSAWRLESPTVGRATFNIAVHEWALRNGAINAQVLADKAVVDRVTTENCPDVRAAVLQALDLTDLAAGIAF